MYLKGQAKVNVRKISDEEKKPAPAAAAAPVPKTASRFQVAVNSNSYTVEIQGNKAVVNGVTYDVSVQEAAAAVPAPAQPAQAAPAPVAAAPVQSAAPSGNGASVNLEAPLPGLVIRFSARVGDRVNEGDEILVIESMKMEQPLTAPASGVVSSFSVAQGDQIQAGQVLAVIKQ